jgi:hypothetical protein
MPGCDIAYVYDGVYVRFPQFVCSQSRKRSPEAKAASLVRLSSIVFLCPVNNINRLLRTLVDVIKVFVLIHSSAYLYSVDNNYIAVIERYSTHRSRSIDIDGDGTKIFKKVIAP